MGIINEEDNDGLTFDKEDNMLTTLDNPYNPFTEFDSWYAFDIAKGYNSCSLLAKVCKTSDELSETDQSLDIERAIDEIVKINISGIHVKVTANSFKDRSKIIRDYIKSIV